MAKIITLRTEIETHESYDQLMALYADDNSIMEVLEAITIERGLNVVNAHELRLVSVVKNHVVQIQKDSVEDGLYRPIDEAKFWGLEAGDRILDMNGNVVDVGSVIDQIVYVGYDDEMKQLTREDIRAKL